MYAEKEAVLMILASIIQSVKKMVVRLWSIDSMGAILLARMITSKILIVINKLIIKIQIDCEKIKRV